MSQSLGRRERQIMDIAYQLGEATAEEIRERLPDQPHNASVRTLLRILVDKGHLVHRREKKRYIYSPVVAQDKAGASALKNVVQTFFQGSPQKTLTALLSISRDSLSAEELEQLRAFVEKREEENRDADAS